MKKRLLSFLMAAVLLWSLLTPGMMQAEAADTEEKSRAIGIVFDNSGSMYGGSTAWCSATYAMEVFAAMMNDGDQVQIYPMWPITVGRGGREYDSDSPLVINGPDEAEQIRNIVTEFAGGTPVETITAAYEGLSRTNADLKYLIVLTDGTSFHQGGVDMGSGTGAVLTEMLGDYAHDIHTLYLGIGYGAAEPTEELPDRQYFDSASESREILQKLTAMGNSIFGRDELSYQGDEITFDVSMNKIIVFAQGENISDLSVSGGTKLSDHATRYPVDGLLHGGAISDTSLQGMLVTYRNFDAGTYKISYTGDATSVSVYYEPDVDLAIELLDSGGNVVDPATQDIEAGDYEIRYSMVDRDGNPTNSPLLGQVEYDLTYSINGKEYTVTDTQSGSFTLTLESEDKLDGEFDARFLNKYSLHLDGEALGWGKDGFEVKKEEPKELTLSITGGAEEYNMSDLEKRAVYEVELLYDGLPLTGEDLDRAGLEAEISGGNLQCKVERDGDRFLVSACYGTETAREGKCKLTMHAAYVNKSGEQVESEMETRSFRLVDNCSQPKIEFVLDQDYYIHSDVTDTDGFQLRLTLGGQPLTAEQFRMAKVDFDVDGLACDIQPDPDKSCYQISLKADSVENGKYRVRCKAQVPNEIGQLKELKDTASLQIRSYPVWVAIAFWAGVLLLILLLIWLYMNMKVLPKHIVTSETTRFVVNGNKISGPTSVTYTGKNAKKGILRVTSPTASSVPGARSGYELVLKAVSPRRVASASRTIRVVKVIPIGSRIRSIQLDSVTLIKDKSGELKPLNQDETELDVELYNGSQVTVLGKALHASYGMEVSCNLMSELEFY